MHMNNIMAKFSLKTAPPPYRSSTICPRTSDDMNMPTFINDMNVANHWDT